MTKYYYFINKKYIIVSRLISLYINIPYIHITMYESYYYKGAILAMFHFNISLLLLFYYKVILGSLLSSVVIVSPDVKDAIIGLSCFLLTEEGGEDIADVSRLVDLAGTSGIII